jgi:arylsulfatase A-like enzyme/Flp pilus assembly protein TadD
MMRTQDRRRKVLFLHEFILLLLLGLSYQLALAEQKKEGRWNVLLITIDTLRPDRLSCYSTLHVQTPRIDSLAAKGALFLKAFAHTPTTLPSHTNILLGTTPLYHGVHDNQNFVVPKEFLSLAGLLKQNGYATGAFVGAFPLDSRFGLTRGFDIYDDNYGSKINQEFSYVERRAEVVVQKASDWLEQQRNPWFLWIHCFDPHQKYDPPEPFKTKFKDHPYDGEVAYVDFALGPLLDLIEKKGLDKTTLVVLTGDHGESLGEHGEATHGYFAYNSSIWVPLIISFPGIKSAKVDDNVSHVDIYPTVCEILGLKKPSFLQGLSLLPAIQGKPMPRREIYVESLYPYYSRGWAPLQGFIRGPEKYLDSPIPEFYDLDGDFDETKNLAEAKKLDPYRAALEDLKKKNASSGQTSGERKPDRETIERLKSLGYVTSPQAPGKKAFTPQDDLKVLLPYQSKLMQAMGAYHRGNMSEGIRLLEEIIAERKDFDLAYTYLATLYKEQRRFKEAVAVLREGYQYCPKSYKVITTFGIFLTEVGEYDAALGILQEGLAIIDYDPELWNYLGMAYWKKGDLEKALEAFEKCLELDTNYSIAFNNIGSVFLSRYLKRQEAESLKKAMENFKKAIELDPRYTSAYNGLGGVYLKAGRIDEAIACWEKTVELDPEYGQALYNLGLAYLTKGDRPKALEALKKYKDKYYHLLPAKEKENLDALIKRIQGSR